MQRRRPIVRACMQLPLQRASEQQQCALALGGPSTPSHATHNEACRVGGGPAASYVCGAEGGIGGRRRTQRRHRALMYYKYNAGSHGVAPEPEPASNHLPPVRPGPPAPGAHAPPLPCCRVALDRGDAGRLHRLHTGPYAAVCIKHLLCDGRALLTRAEWLAWLLTFCMLTFLLLEYTHPPTCQHAELPVWALCYLCCHVPALPFFSCSCILLSASTRGIYRYV